VFVNNFVCYSVLKMISNVVEKTNRVPFSLPLKQNDNDFKGKIRQTKKPWKSTTDCQFAQSEQPWDRLYKVQTLASKRRQYHYFDPQSPLDKLDFNIKTVYNQHTDVFVDCNMAVCQLETTENEDVHKRKLKNRTKLISPKHDPMKPPLLIETSKTRMHADKYPGAIVSHHSPASKGGYSRKKENQGFFAI